MLHTVPIKNNCWHLRFNQWVKKLDAHREFLKTFYYKLIQASAHKEFITIFIAFKVI